MEELLRYGLTILLVLCGACCDLKAMRIPNKLTLSFCLAGMLFNTVCYGLAGSLNSFLGIAAGFLWILLFAFGALGAGDVKLFMAVGALLGWRLCICTALLSFLIGGLVGVVVLILRKNGRRRFAHLYRYLWLLTVSKKFMKYDVIDKENDGYFSFGSCIAAGCIAAVILDVAGMLSAVIPI